jgi:hypothetical protein
MAEDDDVRIAPGSGAAAVLKLPELFGSQGDGARGQALFGELSAAVTA